MAVAYESFSATALAATNTVVITKPTGLAVGDYMFAQLIGGKGNGGAAITPPSGWATYYNNTPSLSGASVPCGLFYKVATSGDVSASNFTFTLSDSGSTEYFGGAIFRLSGVGAFDGEDTEGPVNLTTGTRSYASGIDPAFANCLILLFLYGGDNANILTADLSSPAIATDNPTWTSQSNDYRREVDITMFMRMYTAPRAAATAWGNLSWAANQGTGAGIGALAIAINVAPLINGSHSVVTGPTYIVNQPFLKTGTVTTDGTDPVDTTINPTIWTPVTKS